MKIQTDLLWKIYIILVRMSTHTLFDAYARIQLYTNLHWTRVKLNLVAFGAATAAASTFAYAFFRQQIYVWKRNKSRNPVTHRNLMLCRFFVRLLRLCACAEHTAIVCVCMQYSDGSFPLWIFVYFLLDAFFLFQFSIKWNAICTRACMCVYCVYSQSGIGTPNSHVWTSRGTLEYLFGVELYAVRVWVCLH